MDDKAYYTTPGPPYTYSQFVMERNNGAGFNSQSTLAGVDVQGATATGAMFAIENPGAVEMFDINGDGIPDRVMSELSSAAPYDYLLVQLGTGTGFLPVRRFGPSTMQGKTDWYTGLSAGGVMKIIDINGDGLPDRVMLEMLDRNSNNTQTQYPQYMTKFVVEFNNGYTFEEHDWLNMDPQWNAVNGVNLSGATFASIESAPFVGLFDINGDHLPDRVMTKWSDHTKWLVQINNGSGFENAVDFNNVSVPPGAPDDPLWYGINGVDPSSGNMFAGLSDINGDGLVDRVMADYNAVADQSGSIAGFRVNLNSGMVPDLMLSTDNGMGSSTTVQYSPSTAWDNRKDTSNSDSARMLPFVVQTVTNLSVLDGINAARATSYQYGGGFFDPSRREFAGFACVTNTDPSNRKTDRKTVYCFHQGGGRDNAANGEFADDGNFAKRGIPYRIESYRNDTHTPLVYNVVVNQVDQFDLGHGRRFPYIRKTLTFDYPGGGTPNAKATEFVYDSATGNLTKRIVYGKVTANLTTFVITDSVAADTQYHQILYATITGNTYIRDHPDKIRLTSDLAGSTVVQETKYSYNANSDTLSTEETQLSPGQYSLESHQYDTFGVQNLFTDATGVQTFVSSFDTTCHIYPTSTRKRVTADTDSVADHITATTYDVGSGLLTAATDPMGIKMQNTYDEFFRLTETDKGITPDGSATALWVKKVNYNLGGVTAGTSANYVRARVNDGVDTANGIESWAYADGLGRVIETRTEAEVAGQFRVVSIAY